MKRSFTERRQRRARLALIKLAAQESVFVRSSLTDGLRAVLLFERINGVTADLNDFQHRMILTNTGYHFHLQRRLKAIAPFRPMVRGDADG